MRRRPPDVVPWFLHDIVDEVGLTDANLPASIDRHLQSPTKRAWLPKVLHMFEEIAPGVHLEDLSVMRSVSPADSTRKQRFPARRRCSPSRVRPRRFSCALQPDGHVVAVILSSMDAYMYSSSFTFTQEDTQTRDSTDLSTRGGHFSECQKIGN